MLEKNPWKSGLNRTIRTLLLTVGILSSSFTPPGFKSQQKTYPRVRTAYAEKGEWMENLLKEKGLSLSGLQLYLRTFKMEKELEVWARDDKQEKFVKICSYSVCQTSGKFGPKRRQGDRQIPEGFYHINRFNPYSSYYLSLGLNYPNPSDKILGNRNNLGGDIFIHGSCVTIGCIPITDDCIKELYILCVEAKDAGQEQIPVSVFPAKMTEENWNKLRQKYQEYPEFLGLWEDLKTAYEVFNSFCRLPEVTFLSGGRHRIR